MRNILRLISVLLVAIVFCGCKKNNDNTPNYTAGIGGTRVWHGIDQGTTDANGYGTGTAFSYTLNETFEIQVINGTTISFWGQSSVYDHTDTVAKAYVFSCTRSGNSYPLNGYLRYFYNENRITIDVGGGGIHGDEDYSLATP